MHNKYDGSPLPSFVPNNPSITIVGTAQPRPGFNGLLNLLELTHPADSPSHEMTRLWLEVARSKHNWRRCRRGYKIRCIVMYSIGITAERRAPKEGREGRGIKRRLLRSLSGSVCRSYQPSKLPCIVCSALALETLVQVCALRGGNLCCRSGACHDATNFKSFPGPLTVFDSHPPGFNRLV